MSEIIMDTNVAVIANRQNDAVVQSCVDACIAFLSAAREQHVVLIDDADEIRAEYARALARRRPYELGAQFLFHVLQPQYNPKHVRRVSLPLTDAGAFIDFPTVPELTGFDPSDRKFAALSRRTNVPVTNAADSDWVISLAALNANGIHVDFLCGSDRTRWFVA